MLGERQVVGVDADLTAVEGADAVEHAVDGAHVHEDVVGATAEGDGDTRARAFELRLEGCEQFLRAVVRQPPLRVCHDVLPFDKERMY